MNDSLKKEIQNIIEHLKFNYTVNDFDKSVNWYQWNQVSKYINLSESFIERYKDKMDWDKISEYQQLSESFIKRFKDKVNWDYISQYQKLSESFIERYYYKVNWRIISEYQKLSESFIKKHKGYVDWYYISKYQKLSKPFIEKHKTFVNWKNIYIYQKLSENFIEKHKGYVDWYWISKYQKLSENFIERFKDKVHWNYILTYQKLSPAFIEKNKLEIPRNNTNYMTKKQISELIPDCYEREGDYIIAYKNIRTDRYSHFNFQYCYEKGNTYESHCDCNNDIYNSFGLSLWTYKEAKNYRRNGIVVKCQVKIEDIGAVVHGRTKLRCKRIEVLS